MHTRSLVKLKCLAKAVDRARDGAGAGDGARAGA